VSSSGLGEIDNSDDDIDDSEIGLGCNQDRCVGSGGDVDGIGSIEGGFDDIVDNVIGLSCNQD